MSLQVNRLRDELKQKEAHSHDLERQKHVIQLKLEEVERESETKMKYETLTVKQCLQDEIKTLKSRLETTEKTKIDLERQLQELQEQHETAQYFSNLYKVRFFSLKQGSAGRVRVREVMPGLNINFSPKFVKIKTKLKMQELILNS